MKGAASDPDRGGLPIRRAQTADDRKNSGLTEGRLNGQLNNLKKKPTSIIKEPAGKMQN